MDVVIIVLTKCNIIIGILIKQKFIQLKILKIFLKKERKKYECLYIYLLDI